MYQSYRNVLFTVGKVDQNKLENPISAALDFKSTINNLRERAGTWEFNFLIFNNQINKSGMVTHGNIALRGVKSSTPRILRPAKEYFLIDDMLVRLCQVSFLEVFTGKNLSGIAQLDFNYFIIIIVPAIIIIIAAIMAGLVSITLRYPGFLVFFTGIIINYLINVEELGNMIFLMFRDIFFYSLFSVDM